MLTIHPVLQVGPFDHSADPVPASRYLARLDAVQGYMRARGWGGIVIFASRAEYAAVQFLTGYTPRLGDALLLVPAAGLPTLLAFEGRRMVDAGRQTTWLDQVEPVGDLSTQVDDWLQSLPSGTVALCHGARISHAVFERLHTLAALAGALDATDVLLDFQRRDFDPDSLALRGAVAALAEAEAAISAGIDQGRGARACALEAESVANRHNLQDLRALYAVDGVWCGFDDLPEGECARLNCYLALRYWHGWVDGSFTVGNRGVDGSAADTALSGVVAGLSPGPITDAQGGPELSDAGLRVRISRRNGISPDLTAGAFANEVLLAGDLVAVSVSAAGDGVWSSALALVGEDASRLLWRSGKWDVT
jgi:hypothetical protein